MSLSTAFNLNIGCRYDNPAVIHPFAFRVHAHSLGKKHDINVHPSICYTFPVSIDNCIWYTVIYAILIYYKILRKTFVTFLSIKILVALINQHFNFVYFVYIFCNLLVNILAYVYHMQIVFSNLKWYRRHRLFTRNLRQ